MRQEDAILCIIDYIRRPPAQGVVSGYSSYGYDLYIPNVIREFMRSQGQDPNQGSGSTLVRSLSPVFFDGAWELARRGIIRPGVRIMGEQSTDEGSAGAGFCITPFGRSWLDEETDNIWVPTEPDRFAEMIAPFRSRFGDGFHSRSQEAVRCYGAHAYLACCAMCGAAAESILLATAIAKVGSEPEVLKKYLASGGRRSVEQIVVGQAPDNLRREFLGLTSLLKYWRDAAAHGVASSISDNEAYTSLALLLRYASVVDEKWQELTGA